MVNRRDMSTPARKVVSATSKADGLQLKVPFEGKPDKEIQPTAYVFDRSGAFVTSAPLKEGQVQLNISEAQVRGVRLFFGPSIEGRRLQPTLDLMERLHAYEPRFVFDPKERIHELLPIPEIDWKRWLWCSCRVRGKVVKPVTISGVTTNMPVCHARVHVCEVDPLWLILRRVPDPIIIRIREYLRVRPPFPPPPPELELEPVFEFDTSIFEASAKNIAAMNKAASMPAVVSAMERVMFDPQPEPPKLLQEMQKSGIISEIEKRAFNPQPEPPGKPMFDTLPSATQAALLSESVSTVRETLLANIDLIRPFICGWPWIWPYFYTCDELAVLDTDTNGRFDTIIWYPCFGDHPDLYFWVEFCIGGVWTTVYHPPIRCNTFWNYACGSEVTIRVTDPRVPWCDIPPSLPGKQVGVMLIGHNVSLHEIQGHAAGLNEGLTADGRPFGGRLEPVVWFGQDDLIAAGITHYRWSYQKMDGIDTWHAMDRQVVRHYAVISPTPPYDLTFKPFLLGPDPAFPTKNLFKIQPKNPPAGAYGWAPQIDARENSASAFFLSHLLNGGNAATAAGKYELKLELFDNAGNLVNMTNAGILLKVPNVDGPFGTGTVTTVPPTAEHLILDGDGKIVAFRLVLHVDNNPCQAEIYPTSVNGHAAGLCGFISYPPGSNAHISFKARHPNNFATFSFGTYRGSSGIMAVASCSGPVGASPLNGFLRNAASVFAKDILVVNLVGGCPGGKGAFSENLHVDAIVTDGWSILEYLDANATPKAFALEPE